MKQDPKKPANGELLLGDYKSLEDSNLYYWNDGKWDPVEERAEQPGSNLPKDTYYRRVTSSRRSELQRIPYELRMKPYRK